MKNNSLQETNTTEKKCENFVSTVTYSSLVDWLHVAEKYEELQDMPQKQQEETHGGLHLYQQIKGVV